MDELGILPSHRPNVNLDMEGTFKYDENDFILSTFETNSNQINTYNSWFGSLTNERNSQS